MRAYQILPGDNIDGLQCVDFPRVNWAMAKCASACMRCR
jgi:hypothetical protein